ncbi:hypothetical protein C2G38_2152734 [Gigaspora rosea]|uniref:Uncharacterized protein n=1 Tax=Gigaspora rosea TaxID=44941 RepID=A0A397WC22_9GLOM|nr:hypothetical protein C2G38_2152734 [Gigaspora rosea]
MPREENKGPCKVKDCNNDDITHYYKFTTYAKKSIDKNTFDEYNYLEINDQLCDMHYLKIVEPDRNNITIDIVNDEVILNKDDFTKLINRANQLEIFQAEINQNSNKTNSNISTSTLSFENKIDLLSKILFKEQRRLNNPIELDPKKFSELITKSNFFT